MRPQSHQQLYPQSAGVGLRAPYEDWVLQERPQLGFLEVHSENYFGESLSLYRLLEIREHYPISLHGVGLGLASPTPLNLRHLAQLRRLVRTVNPVLVSEHLCWNQVSEGVVNDLLPPCYDEKTLRRVIQKVHQIQDLLQCTVALENLSSYWLFPENEMTEAEFLAEVVKSTQCFLLLDINNVYVNQKNWGINPWDFINSLPRKAIKEIHLAGHEQENGFWIDTHGSPVCSDVWALYEQVIDRLGPIPTLLERDQNYPSVEELWAEYEHIRAIQYQRGERDEPLSKVL
jgi:hypothetical protein